MELNPAFPVAAIIVEDRFRKVFPNDEETLNSIKEKGIKVPLIITRKGKLVAGERRLICARKLGLQTVPVIFEEDDDELNQREVELIENLYREGFTDEEKVSAVREIHRLKQLKHGGGQGIAGGWTLKDTAVSLGMGRTQAGVYIQVADGVERYAEVKDTLHKHGVEEAYKRLQQKQAEEAIIVLAERSSAKTEQLGAPLPLLQGDALALIKDIPSESINLVMADPPYGVGVDSMNLWGMYKGGIKFDDSAKAVTDLLVALAPEVYRVLTANGWFFYWTSFNAYPVFKEIMENAHFNISLVPFVWVKDTHLPPCSDLKHSFASSFELGIYGWKGEGQLVKQGKTNCITCPLPTDKLHPFEKPVGLQAELVSRFCLPTHTVLDPFTGSGSIPKACISQRMKWIAFEKDEATYAIAKTSIMKVLQQGTQGELLDVKDKSPK